MKIRNQKDAVLNYLDRYGSITQRIASDLLGVDRLSPRVSEINDILLGKKDKIVAEGWEKFIGKYVASYREYAINRYGQRVMVARYRLNDVLGNRREA